MASFHRDPKRRSPYWYVAFTDAEQKRVFRSSGETVLNKAQEVGLRWEREAAVLRSTKATQLGAVRVFSNPNVVLERFIEASLAATRGDFTEAIARRFVDELLNSVGERSISGSSTRAFLDAWVEGKKTSRAEGTYLR